MKTTLIKGCLLVAMTFSSFIVKPNIGNNEACLHAEKTIKDSVKLPAGYSSGNQKVEILFSAGLNGNVNFVLAKTTDLILKQQIEKQFYNMHFTGLNTDVVNSVTLNFKTL